MGTIIVSLTLLTCLLIVGTLLFEALLYADEQES